MEGSALGTSCSYTTYGGMLVLQLRPDGSTVRRLRAEPFKSGRTRQENSRSRYGVFAPPFSIGARSIFRFGGLGFR